MKVPSPLSRLLQHAGVTKKKQMPLSREEAFKAHPVRNPQLKWRINENEGVEVIVPRRKDWLGRTVGFLFFVPENRPVTLDEVGSRVWNLCDGDTTVNEIIETLAEEYKLGRREVEASLTEYLRTLGQRGMVGFLIPHEAIEDADEGELVGLQDIGSTREDLEAAQEAARELERAEAARDAAEQDDEDAAEESSEQEPSDDEQSQEQQDTVR